MYTCIYRYYLASWTFCGDNADKGEAMYPNEKDGQEMTGVTCMDFMVNPISTL